MARDIWRPILKALIEEAYGEPERPGEHCEAAAEAVFEYMEKGLSLKADEHTVVDMYELYMFARHLHRHELLGRAEQKAPMPTP